VFGGLVFQPLSSGFLKTGKIKNVDLLYHYSSFLDKELYLEKPEIIAISKILPDPINAYLKEFINGVVDRINGKNIRTLEDVSAAFKEPADYYVIQLMGKRRPVVLQQSEVAAARERILKGYNVGSEYYLGDSIVPKDWLVESVRQEPRKTD
jgi:PDZ domain-containing protein